MSKELEAVKFLMNDGFINEREMKKLLLIEKALKRNEPMKVINGINYKGQDVMLCPNCERNAGKINDRYCSNCGQKLDWL